MESFQMTGLVVSAGGFLLSTFGQKLVPESMHRSAALIGILLIVIGLAMSFISQNDLTQTIGFIKAGWLYALFATLSIYLVRNKLKQREIGGARSEELDAQEAFGVGFEIVQKEKLIEKILAFPENTPEEIIQKRKLLKEETEEFENLKAKKTQLFQSGQIIPPLRIGLLEFMREAELRGWDIRHDLGYRSEMERRLRQAAIDEKITIWGQVTDQGGLLPIRGEKWIECHLDLTIRVVIHENGEGRWLDENSYSYISNPNNDIRMGSIHLDRADSLKWLISSEGDPHGVSDEE